MPNIDPEIQKQAVKEALQEWLDEKFSQFGKWTLTGIAAMAFAGCAYLFLSSHGFKP